MISNHYLIHIDILLLINIFKLYQVYQLWCNKQLFDNNFLFQIPMINIKIFTFPLHYGKISSKIIMALSYSYVNI